MSGFSKIILTTDFSDTSKQAFQPAVTLAEKFGSKILLAYVEEDRLPPLAGEFPGVQGIPLTEILENHRKLATEELAKLARTELASVEAEPVALSGVPHREIVRLAEQEKADLIVMATHGRGFIAHALMGSTTERVIRHAPCPVLAVRQSESED